MPPADLTPALRDRFFQALPIFYVQCHLDIDARTLKSTDQRLLSLSNACSRHRNGPPHPVAQISSNSSWTRWQNNLAHTQGILPEPNADDVLIKCKTERSCKTPRERDQIYASTASAMLRRATSVRVICRQIEELSVEHKYDNHRFEFVQRAIRKKAASRRSNSLKRVVVKHATSLCLYRYRSAALKTDREGALQLLEDAVREVIV